MTVRKWLIATVMVGATSAVMHPVGDLACQSPGRLKIVVAYPAAGAAIDFADSTFLFGTIGNPAARLTVAGQAVKIAPNGAWLAWVALPRDSSFSVRLVAHAGNDSAVASLPLVRAGWVRKTGAWLDRASLAE